MASGTLMASNNQPPAPPQQQVLGLVFEVVGQDGHRLYTVGKEGAVLGRLCRTNTADVCIACPTMSKRHCAIYFRETDGCFVLQDLGSLNGTYYARSLAGNDKSFEMIGDKNSSAEERRANAVVLTKDCIFKAAACVFFVKEVGWLHGVTSSRQLKLRVVHGPDEGAEATIGELGCIVGRHRLHASFVLHDTLNYLSRQHAKFLFDGNVFRVQDMSSTGTWICESYSPVDVFVRSLWGLEGAEPVYSPGSANWVRVGKGAAVEVQPGFLVRCGKATVLAVLAADDASALSTELAHAQALAMLNRCAADAASFEGLYGSGLEPSSDAASAAAAVGNATLTDN